MHLSLLNNRPGFNSSTTELINFTMTRYVRIRLQGMHYINENAVQSHSTSLAKRSFYSLRHIKVKARVMCSGHASKTRQSNNEVYYFIGFLYAL